MPHRGESSTVRVLKKSVEGGVEEVRISRRPVAKTMDADDAIAFKSSMLLKNSANSVFFL